MRMPNLRASRLLRCQETRIVVLAIAVIASMLMLVTSATDRETSSESALVAVAPTTSGKVRPKFVPVSAVPFTIAKLAGSPAIAKLAGSPTVAPPPSPTVVAVAPSTSTPRSVSEGAARQTPAAPIFETVAPATTASAAPPVKAPAKRCAVRLHGKGGSGSPPSTAGGVTYLSPTGNAAGWGGRQWLYFPDSEYRGAVAIVASAIDGEGCTRVTVDGFSNGGAFAAKLYCRGESFGGRLAGVIVDDPVVDNAVNGCAPAAGVAITLYWTGALASQSYPGWDCAEAGWTCDGGSTIGIVAYAAALGTPIKASPMGGHSPYLNPPELLRF